MIVREPVKMEPRRKSRRRKETPRLLANAGRDAAMLLGFNKYGESQAEKDPAAWWCLVELLISYAHGERS